MHPPSSFETAVASLYDTVLDSGRWGDAIKGVARLFDASTACIFAYDFGAQVLSDFRGIGHDAAVQRAYETYYHRLDPGRDAGMQASVGEWVADDQMIHTRSAPAAEYVYDFALRSGIGHSAGFKISGDSSACVFLGVQRRPDAKRFGEEGRQVFLSIAPHLRRITQMHAKIETLSAGLALARNCLDQFRCAVLALDKARRVVLVNAHGARMLGAGRELKIAQQRLICEVPMLDEALARAVSTACRPQPRGAALRLPRRGCTTPLLLVVLPIPPSHDLAGAYNEPLALVVLGEPDAPHLAVDIYRSLFDLTNAEAALMAALVHGVSVREWAAQRGVSVATVRTQVAALLQKAGVDSQARLIALAKSLPPSG